MSAKYTPLTQSELDLIGVLENFSAPTWNGPALPRPEGAEGLEEIFDSVDRLIARGQYLIQPKDGLSITYTLNLHASVGFREVGVRNRIGKRDGIWRDTVLLERRSEVIE